MDTRQMLEHCAILLKMGLGTIAQTD